ncbi:WhiB family transcriptional regulator [Propionimicrobium lymphophilum]|uniref:WhiB family transcriptional regulator n=1 Tax=Propionimicrobium lymphophilum TaxID=33012 RepID=UPI003EC5330A
MPVDQQLEDCWVCPVRRECLRYAFETKSTCVVMGGLKLPMNPLKRLPAWAQD